GVELPGGQMRPEPLYTLSRVGAWFGPQARGYHGGVSLEEVAVPLAFLSRQTGRIDDWLPPPRWWNDDLELVDQAPAQPVAAAAAPQVEAARSVPREVVAFAPAVSAPAASSAPTAAPPAPSVLSTAVRGEIADIAHAEAALTHMAQKGQISQSQLGKLVKRPPFLLNGVLSKIQKRLHAAGQRVPFDEQQRQGEPWYVWKGGEDA
ncbi:MAG: hypothetical protein AAF449_15265, partial [Myxococcota bacterium]